MPTLVDGSLPVWESHTILRYLAAAYAPGRFWSQFPSSRSCFERWMDWSQDGFDNAFMSVFWGHWRTPEADRDSVAIRLQLSRCRGYMRVLNETLSTNSFIGGDNLSLADIAIGALMYRYANLDVHFEST